MILVFGGTTEGKKAANLLDFIGEHYFYSTKRKADVKLRGELISGDMDREAIVEFCKTQNIKLIINASHPFAVNLHQNIFEAAQDLEITTIRYERVFPDISNKKNINEFTSFKALTEALRTSNFKTILSLTGVQTIPHYQKLAKEKSCYYRILNTKESRQEAEKYGIEDKFIIAETPKFTTEQLLRLIAKTNADVLTSKVSGVSGLFQNKIDASNKAGIPLWVVQRPRFPSFTYTVNTEKHLLMLLYKLRKNILKKNDKLRSGYTTGTCVTATAKACMLALVNNQFPHSVNVFLPGGEKTSFLIFPEELSDKKASCVVIKDAGDDPDITHAKEVGCEIILTEKPGVHFLQGKGIGKVTLPGLQISVGEPAINPVPRQMIQSAIEEVADIHEIEGGFDVKPFVPEGEKLAEQTFNPRVGVVGGISIIGTTGKVYPFSNEAFLATIKHQVNVAKKNGLEEVVFTSGKRSEGILKQDYPNLPEIAYIHFGNLVGESIKLAVKAGIKKITIGLMLGKAIKLAEGHLDTHSKKVTFNKNFLTKLARESGYSENITTAIPNLNLVNEIRAIIPFSETEPLYIKIAKRCFQICKKIISPTCRLQFTLIVKETEKIIINY